MGECVEEPLVVGVISSVEGWSLNGGTALMEICSGFDRLTRRRPFPASKLVADVNVDVVSSPLLPGDCKGKMNAGRGSRVVGINGRPTKTLEPIRSSRCRARELGSRGGNTSAMAPALRIGCMMLSRTNGVEQFCAES